MAENKNIYTTVKRKLLVIQTNMMKIIDYFIIINYHKLF